jgi:exo-beta-1,3-glucanase (GH17 family)
MEWSEAEDIPVFFFEAFDESWKGSQEPLEPEKHWGLFKIDRTPKLAVKHFFNKD